MESVPPLTLPICGALSGEHIANVQATSQTTAAEVCEAATLAAGLHVNLQLMHDGRRVPDTETVAEAGFKDQEQLLAVAQRRQRQINRMIEVYEKAERLNACFMVDCTGSMGSHIQAVKTQIGGIVHEMQTRLPNMQLRLSFLGYRDHGDDIRFEILPFTTNVQEFQAFVAVVRAKGGGGDGPEDVHGAVQQACGLDWTAGDAATRVLIHIADHPAHGSHWNDSPRDRYPNGDPEGLDLTSLMQQLQQLDVQYVFGHITDHTQKMVRVLNDELGGYIDTKDMEDAAKVTETVTASLHKSVSTTVSTLTASGGPRRLQAEELCSELPGWSLRPAVPVIVRTCRLVSDVNELLADACPGATRVLEEQSAMVQFAPLPFAQGESRIARHALRDGSAAVAKKFKPKESVSAEDDDDSSEADDDEIQAYLDLSEVSAVAVFLADAFSKNQPDGEKILFLESGVAQASDGGVFNLESALPAVEFQRYSNNIGWWEADAPRPLLHFMRWTYQVTGGHMMVADLQGVKTQDGWLLTDPCILCTDTSRFGSGNLGSYAMERCCKSLSALLEPPAPLAMSSASHVHPPPNAWKGADPLSSGVLELDKMIEELLSVGSKKPGFLIKLPEQQIRALLTASRNTFLKQPSLLELDAPLTVLGDIHGQYHDLLRHFERRGEPGVENYLMLGDYVDRGKQSIETITLLLAYKVKYPENIFLLRGNHECASINRIYGFYDECKRRYNIKLWKQYCDVFNCLPPVALINDSILCMHGGLSPEIHKLDQLRDIVRPASIPDTGMLCDLMWADPDKDVSGWCESDRGVSFTFGPDVVTSFKQKFGLDLIVRAHQVVEDGYEFFANRQLLTLFSAPNYCGEFDNAGAQLKISHDLLCSFGLLHPQKKQKDSAKGGLTSNATN